MSGGEVCTLGSLAENWQEVYQRTDRKFNSELTGRLAKN
jgi:hypothetical protein